MKCCSLIDTSKFCNLIAKTLQTQSMRLTLNVQGWDPNGIGFLHNAEWGNPSAFDLLDPSSQVWCIEASCFLSLQFNYLELISFYKLLHTQPQILPLFKVFILKKTCHRVREVVSIVVFSHTFQAGKNELIIPINKRPSQLSAQDQSLPLLATF